MKNHKWDTTDIPEQTGRVVIITGAGSGIGLETACVLAGKKATVILGVRNLDKGKAAREEILFQHAGADVSPILLDLANLSSVQAFAEAFKSNYTRLDLLVNNAGVMVPPYTQTADGFELQFGTNHLGHFALTAQLMDIILKTPGSRIVNVSSSAHIFGGLDFSDLNWERRKYKKWKAYGDSKRAGLYFTYELQRRIKNAAGDVRVTAAHPGWAATNLQRYTGSVRFLNCVFAQPAEMGALPTLYAALSPDAKEAGFYGPGGFQEMRGYPVEVKRFALEDDRHIAGKLWEVSRQMTGVSYPFRRGA